MLTWEKIRKPQIAGPQLLKTFKIIEIRKKFIESPVNYRNIIHQENIWY